MRFHEFQKLKEFDASAALSSAGNIMQVLTNPLGSLTDIASGDGSSDKAGTTQSSKEDLSVIQDPDFNRKLEKIANKLGVKATDLLAVMKIESSVNPKATNSSGATGLIQFMPSTAKSLGTTTSELYKMSAVEQLDYVYLYYKNIGLKPGSTAGDIYIATFYPKATGKPDDYVISSRGQNIYNQNAVLDKNKDNIITVGDVKKSVQRFA